MLTQIRSLHSFSTFAFASLLSLCLKFNANIDVNANVTCEQTKQQDLQGSHFSGLTKFYDFSRCTLIFPGYPGRMGLVLMC